jgi:hypothetical protein
MKTAIKLKNVEIFKIYFYHLTTVPTCCPNSKEKCPKVILNCSWVFRVENENVLDYYQEVQVKQLG